MSENSLNTFQGMRVFFKTTLEVPEDLLDRLVQDTTAFLDVLDVQSPPRSPRTLALLCAAESVIRSWPILDQASFIHGHPRIGERTALSVLSAHEQQQHAGCAPTPPDVLQRLAHLNDAYERRYPRLRYITFVNGRSRAEIATEMEQKLHLNADVDVAGEPAAQTTVYDVGSPEWSAELDRALTDINLIALSRSKNM